MTKFSLVHFPHQDTRTVSGTEMDAEVDGRECKSRRQADRQAAVTSKVIPPKLLLRSRHETGKKRGKNTFG